MIIQCQSCQTNNIVALTNLAPRCGKCGSPLAVQAVGNPASELINAPLRIKPTKPEVQTR